MGEFEGGFKGASRTAPACGPHACDKTEQHGHRWDSHLSQWTCRCGATARAMNADSEEVLDAWQRFHAPSLDSALIEANARAQARVLSARARRANAPAKDDAHKKEGIHKKSAGSDWSLCGCDCMLEGVGFVTVDDDNAVSCPTCLDYMQRETRSVVQLPSNWAPQHIAAARKAYRDEHGPSQTASGVRPPHYGGDSNPFEPIKIIEHYNLNFALGNVIKYTLRSGRKGDEAQADEDLQKALTYLQFEIARRARRNENARSHD